MGSSDHPELGDHELVRAAIRRDDAGKEAFRVLVLRHQAWLIRYLYYLTSSMSDAEDVAQDVFIRAYLALNRYSGKGSFRAWVRVIATRLAFNHQRDRQTQRRYEQKVEMPRTSASPEGPLLDRDALLKVLDDLSYPYREVLILRYVEEMSIKEISVALDLGLSASKMRLSRARKEFWSVYRAKVEVEGA